MKQVGPGLSHGVPTQVLLQLYPNPGDYGAIPYHYKRNSVIDPFPHICLKCAFQRGIWLPEVDRALALFYQKIIAPALRPEVPLSHTVCWDKVTHGVLEWLMDYFRRAARGTPPVHIGNPWFPFPGKLVSARRLVIGSNGLRVRDGDDLSSRLTGQTLAEVLRLAIMEAIQFDQMS